VRVPSQRAVDAGAVIDPQAAVVRARVVRAGQAAAVIYARRSAGDTRARLVAAVIHARRTAGEALARLFMPLRHTTSGLWVIAMYTLRLPVFASAP